MNPLDRRPLPHDISTISTTNISTNTNTNLSHCGHCNKSLSKNNACSRCLNIAYCNKECQRANWKQHKTVCVSSTATIGGLKTQVIKEERDSVLNKLEAGRNVADVSQMSTMNQMYSKMPPNILQQMHAHLGLSELKRISNFVHEFTSDRKSWPIVGMSSSCKANAIRLLELNYQNSSYLPHLMAVGMIQEGHDLILNHPHTLIKRLHGISPEILDWYMSSNRRPGDVFTGRGDIPIGYSKHISASFGNAPPILQPLTRGTHHVAVGFVDLGILAYGSLTCAPSGTGVNDPLRFVGYDFAAYCVAKSLVVWEMVMMAGETKDGHSKASIDSIVQVWYSSIWTKHTDIRFRNAAGRVLKNVKMNNETEGIIRHWTVCTSVSVKRSRDLWINSRGTNPTCPGIFARRTDRIQNARYVVSGEVGIPKDMAKNDLVGSTTMWSFPDGTSPMEDGEEFLSSIPKRPVIELLANMKISFMDAVLTVAREGVNQLISYAMNNMVTVELHCKHISLEDDPELCRHIRSMHPWSMSWSNVLDYIHPPIKFHALARACSGEDCIHFGYSMNWMSDTWGMNLLDYGPKKLKIFLLKAAVDAIKLEERLSGTSSIFRSPPPENPHNIACYGLAIAHYRNWVETYFFHGIEYQGPVKYDLENVIKICGWWPVHRSSTSIELTWTYDAAITFNIIHPDI